ncbi:hypothetical protein D1646_14635 [Pseudoflavonifractor sp. 60]|nr:hypothetical protein [Pseudoflavonifractor sp. 60]
MNLAEVLTYLNYAAQTAIGCSYLILGIVLFSFEMMGPAVWAVPAVCAVLVLLDLTGRLSLRGSFSKAMAAFSLPVLLGWGGMIMLDGMEWRFSWDLSCLGAFLLLSAYALLRKERGEGLDHAASLLEQGSFLGIAAVTWLVMLAGLVAFMGTAGLLLVLFIGAIIAQQNTLLDYGLIWGILAGLAALYVLQCWWYWRGVRQIQRAAPEVQVNRLALFIPLWNFTQARRLELQIRLGQVEIGKDRGVDHDDFGDNRPHRRGQDNPPAGGGKAGGRSDRL